VFPESGLLKVWPQAGPKLLWSRQGLDVGYASVSVTGSAIYLAGRHEAEEYLTVLDLDGTVKWRIRYGNGVKGSFPDTRCTPTIEGDDVYLISGGGEVVRISAKQRKVVWSVPALEKFQGEYWNWEIAESPLLVDDKVIYTPGGEQTSMVALKKTTGETVWQTDSLGEPSAFVSPILVEHGGKKIVVNILTEHLIGVDAANGKTLWKVKYTDIEPPTFHEWAPKNNCITPLYHDGHLFVTSGYDHVGVMFKLVNGGEDIEQVWLNRTLDTHHGQVVRVGDTIYGSNWIDNRKGNWCSLDWKTGKTNYEHEWQTKGSIVAADGMLYCYDEKKGTVGLVRANPHEFQLVSSFAVTMGKGPHWTQPVIRDGVLYIRHGDALMAYKISV
jgi:outer membrane protein assembly factor BamB